VPLECWDTGLLPKPAQWVKDLIPGLGTPYAMGQPKKRGERKKKKRKKGRGGGRKERRKGRKKGEKSNTKLG